MLSIYSTEVRNNSILLVEDDSVTQMFMRRIINKAGYSIFTASNGKEACEMFSRSRFGLVLMDIQMPVLDGIEAFKIMRNAEKKMHSYTPIIAVTANTGMANECLDCGMDGFLSKPVSIPQLHKVISEHVGNNNAENLINDIKENQKKTAVPTNEYKRHYLKALSGLADDSDLFYDLINILLERWHIISNNILDGYKEGNAEKTAAALHTLKGSVGLFGSEGFNEEIASYIETARCGILPDKKACISRIALELDYISGLKRYHEMHTNR